MALRYPTDGFSGDMDYVAFRHMKYSARRSGAGGAGGDILLCMPRSMPLITNPNGWSRFSFGEGPIGEVKEDLFNMAGEFSSQPFHVGASEADKQRGIEKYKGMFDRIIGENLEPASRQAILNAAASGLQVNPTQAMSVTQGQIYNPNIELAYTGPQLRSFSFQFEMVPKSAGEASMISNIIGEFKKWSAPQANGNGMYEVPHVWQVSFMSGGGQNQYQNKFKAAALRSISVSDNAGVSFYSAHQGGAPVSTSLGLEFMEVDVITRKDHSGGRGM
jgi:hypothetical protein